MFIVYFLYCPGIADSESPVGFPQEKLLPPERRLSAELRRAKSLRNPARPLLSSKSRQKTLPASQSFNYDPKALAEIIGDLEDRFEGKHDRTNFP